MCPRTSITRMRKKGFIGEPGPTEGFCLLLLRDTFPPMREESAARPRQCCLPGSRSFALFSATTSARGEISFVSRSPPCDPTSRCVSLIYAVIAIHSERGAANHYKYYPRRHWRKSVFILPVEWEAKKRTEVWSAARRVRDILTSRHIIISYYNLSFRGNYLPHPELAKWHTHICLKQLVTVTTRCRYGH